MNLIILYASILIQGQTMNLEFKNALFKTQKDCKYYLSRHEDFVMDTLNIHLKIFTLRVRFYMSIALTKVNLKI